MFPPPASGGRWRRRGRARAGGARRGAVPVHCPHPRSPFTAPRSPFTAPPHRSLPPSHLRVCCPEPGREKFRPIGQYLKVAQKCTFLCYVTRGVTSKKSQWVHFRQGPPNLPTPKKNSPDLVHYFFSKGPIFLFIYFYIFYFFPKVRGQLPIA